MYINTNGGHMAKYTKQEREEYVEKYKSSGKSIPIYSKEAGISPATLGSWLKRKRQQNQPPQKVQMTTIKLPDNIDQGVKLFIITGLPHEVAQTVKQLGLA